MGILVTQHEPLPRREALKITASTIAGATIGGFGAVTSRAAMAPAKLAGTRCSTSSEDGMALMPDGTGGILHERGDCREDDSKKEHYDESGFINVEFDQIREPSPAATSRGNKP